MAQSRFPLSLSPGFHFLPSERELVWYLQRKVRGEDDGVVTEVDIYGDKNPWELFDKDLKKDYYVFTKLKKKNMNGSRIDRIAGSGTWKERQTKDQDKNDAHWIRKEYLFEIDKKKKKTESSDVNGHWNMYEYSLTADGDKANDYVICKIKNKHASQEDYGPEGLEGIARFLAQIRNLKQPTVKEPDDDVRSSNKRKLQIEEDRPELLKKYRRSSSNNNNSHPVETLQSAGHVQQKQLDSNKLVSLPVDPISTLAGPYSCCDNTFGWFEVQTEVNGDTNLFAASTVDQIAAALMDNVDNSFSSPATVFPEDQYQQVMNNNCYNFQYRNGEENFDPTATPVLLAAEQPLVPESMEQQLGASLLLSENFDDPSEEDFYFSLQELLDDPPEF